MSTPANPLDKFISYTYHFELHAAPSWTELQDLAAKDENKATDSFTPNGTLLINTRKDAHQVIDDVRFLCLAEATSTSEFLTPGSELSMTIMEPGGFSFIEKINAVRDQYGLEQDISTSLVFVLKIFFVGRYADNTIETVTAKLIPMTLRPNMSAVFSELGGRYTLSFVMDATAALARTFEAGPALSVAYTKRSVSFHASTIEEALGLLQEKLNAGYKELFKNEAVPQGRPLEYKITWDPEIRGALETLNKSSNAPNEKSHFVSNPQRQIGAFIMEILQASPKLQQRIGESLPNLRKEGHPNIFVPVIVPSILKLKDKMVVHYHVAVNKGGAQNTIEFDYYFADAGKNVDILSYEVKFQALGAWAPLKTEVGHDLAFNRSATVPSERPKIYKDNIVTPDTTRSSNTVDVQRSELNYGPNDVRVPPRVSVSERTGYNNAPFSSTPGIRMASAVMDDFKAAIAFNQLFEIRGNLDLLDASAHYPDGSVTSGLTGGKNIWIKVNIWMPDPRTSSGKRQFYYTGKYQLISVENVFSNGQFKQNLSVLATPESEAA